MNRWTLSQYDQQIVLWERMLWRLYAARNMLWGAAVWALVWGTVVLSLRTIWGTSSSLLLWGAVGWIPVVVWAIYWGWRQLPSRSVLRAWIDKQSACGGFLMSAEEVQMGSWERYLPESSFPTLRWKSGRTWGMLCLSLLFLLGSFWAPQKLFAPSNKTTSALAVREPVGQLQKQIAVLEQQKVLSPERAKELEQVLKQIEKQARGDDPAKTWQALDSMAQQIQNMAQQAAENMLAQTEKWAQAEQRASALSQLSQHLKPSELSKEMKQLAQMMQNALQAQPELKNMLTQHLPKELAQKLTQALQQGKLSPDILKSASGMCRNARMIQGNKLAQLVKAGLIGKQAMTSQQQINASIQPTPWTPQNQGQSQGQGQGEGQGQGAGQGGVSRGPGKAAMSWKNPSAEKGALYKPQELPTAKLADLRRSQMMGMSIGTPQSSKPGQQGSQGQGLGTASTTNSSAHTHPIYPQHLGTIRRYFHKQ